MENRGNCHGQSKPLIHADWEEMDHPDQNTGRQCRPHGLLEPLDLRTFRPEEVEGNPGYYTSKFFLRPHYQLEGLTVSLRLTSKLPSAKS